MPDEYKWLTTNRTGHCVLCNAETHQGERILWSLIDKKKIWCQACGSKLGPTDNQVAVSKENTPSSLTTTTTTPPYSPPKVRCENCGEQVEHVTHVIRIGAVDVNLNMCDDCDWLRRASWQLKLNGMWKPTPKNEPLREAKP